MSKKENTLEDAQIKGEFQSNEEVYRDALREAKRMLGDVGNAHDDLKVVVSAGSLRKVVKGLLTLRKALEAENQAVRMMRPLPQFLDGDTGPDCDYNPFKGIDF